jgi:hypothetical protein
MKLFVNKNINIKLIIILIGIFYLYLISSGVYPFLFSDEYSYNKYSRLSTENSGTLVNYAYFRIYRITNFCGDEFLGCVRLINIFFYLSGCLAIYGVCTKYLSKYNSLFIFVLSILLPINSYTTFFIPEPMYFCLFWLLILATEKINYNNKYHICLLGILFASLSLTKPHALFLLPSYLIYLYFLVNQRGVKNKLFNLLYFIVSFAVIIYGTLYLESSRDGLNNLSNFFTKSYIEILSEDLILRIFKSSTLVALKLLSALYLLFPMTFLVIILYVQSFWSGVKILNDNRMQPFIFFIILSSITLLIIASGFTTSIAGSEVTEALTRVHLRYINFIYPGFLLISLFIYVNLNKEYKSSKLILLTSVVFYISAYQHADLINSAITDSPFFNSFKLIFYNYKILILFPLSILVVSFFKFNNALKIYVYVYFLFLLVFSNYINITLLNEHKVLDANSRLGLTLKNTVPNNLRNKILLVGSDQGALFKIFFYLDNPDYKALVFNDSNNFDILRVDSKYEFVFLHHAKSPPTNCNVMFQQGYSYLCSLDKDLDINFSNYKNIDSLVHISGMHNSEYWGAWSASDIIEFQFLKPLPSKMVIELEAHAFLSSANKPYYLEIGGQSFKFIPTLKDQIFRFNIKNNLKINSINIVGPNPFSPTELGSGADDRKLGIGINYLRIFNGH